MRTHSNSSFTERNEDFATFNRVFNACREACDAQILVHHFANTLEFLFRIDAFENAPSKENSSQFLM